jgi:hypothetical protein
MNSYIRRVSLSAVAAADASFAALTLSPLNSAAAASPEAVVTGDWVTQDYYPLMYVESSRAGHIAGRLGNWHTASLTIETDDDWVTGLVVDWRCPKKATRPLPGYTDTPTKCTLVGGVEINNPDVIPVTVSPRLRVATAAGNVTANEILTGAPTRVDLDVTWLGTGKLVRDVTGGTTVNQAGDPEQWRSTDASRYGVVGTGVVAGFDLGARRAVTKANPIYLYTYEVRAIP